MQQLELINSKSKLYLADADTAITVWPDIKKLIDAANDMGGGKFYSKHWLGRILFDQADLFVNAALTTAVIAEIQIYPTGKRVYMIVLMGSEGNCDWDSFGYTLEARAKFKECHSIEVYGRKGWKHILEKRGMKFAHMVWRKEI